MTDHFENIACGEHVVITLRGTLTHYPNWVDLDGLTLGREDLRITSVTVEPEPLKVGDRVLNQTGCEGEIIAIDLGQAWVHVDLTGYETIPVASLEKVSAQ